MVKINIKLLWRYFLHKINKSMRKNSSEMFYTFAGVMPPLSISNLSNFITSWKLVKLPQNFAQGSFSIKLRFWHQIPLTIFPKHSFLDDAQGSECSLEVLLRVFLQQYETNIRMRKANLSKLFVSKAKNQVCYCFWHRICRTLSNKTVLWNIFYAVRETRDIYGNPSMENKESGNFRKYCKKATVLHSATKESTS